MTIRNMMRAIALLLVASALAACGDDGDTVETASAAEVQAAREEASAAARAMEALQDRVEELEAQLDDAGAAEKKVTKRLDYLAGKLKSSLEDLRSSIGSARGAADDAAAEVSAALSKAASVARQLAVLEDRFNFHLRKEHGGG